MGAGMKQYWNETYETMPETALREFQLEKLRKTVAWVYQRVPFYRAKLDEAGLVPEDIQSLEDLPRLPFTIKSDLRDSYPFGLFAVPPQECVRIHASSGTTGKPITGGYTREDMAQWGECMARTLWAAGVRPSDLCQNAYNMGLFTGGLGFLNGAETLGATLVPSGSGQTERQIILIQDFKTTVIFSTPSYALTIAEKAGELGINLRESSLRIGIFGAEPWSEEMRREVEERLGIEAMEAYGLTEMGGPGVAFSCREKKGLHINEDHFIAEIIDPVTEEPLPLGEEGELVLTAIQRRAMPLIRYRVRDLTRLYREPCGCGRTFLKMERVRARSDDMLIVNGVNLFPSQIESLLLEFPELSPHYVIVVSKHGYLDRLAIDVEARREIYDLGEEKLREIEVRVQNRIKGIIGLSARVRIVPYKIIERSEGKAKRVIDQRP